MQQHQYEELSHRHVYFQTKYREYREQFLALRQRYLLVACAWCQQRIGWKRKVGAVPGETSHSICPSCATALFSLMQDWQDAQAGVSPPTQPDAVWHGEGREGRRGAPTAQ